MPILHTLQRRHKLPLIAPPSRDIAQGLSVYVLQAPHISGYV